MNAPRMHRHGDVLLVPVAGIPAHAVPVPRDRGRVVLAYGEVTGHAHVLVAEGVAEMVTSDGLRYLRVDPVSAALTHEEHDTQEVWQGTYRIITQREYTPEAVVNVRD